MTIDDITSQQPHLCVQTGPLRLEHLVAAHLEERETSLLPLPVLLIRKGSMEPPPRTRPRFARRACRFVKALVGFLLAPRCAL